MSSPTLSRFRLAVLSGLVLFMPGCATLQMPEWRFPTFGPKPLPAATPAPGAKLPRPQPKRVWNGENVSGVPSIVIDLGEQRAYFFRGKTLVGETDISSGRDGFDTPPGTYHVIQKDKDHRSNLYGDFVDDAGEVVKSNVDVTKQSPPAGAHFQGAKMPYFLRFRSGYGLHAGRLPGHRASHGCVRLPSEMARHFFENTAVGTPVTVRQ